MDSIMSAFRVTPLLAPVAIVSIAACGAAPQLGSVVRDSAGITIVENDHTRPAWGDSPWTVSDPPAVQIGAAESAGPDQLYGVTYSRLLSNGDIAIVNSRTQEVRIFDSLGRYRRTIGRRGDGPGEFRGPWEMYPLPGDSLLVIDLYRAVSVFDEDGNYVRRFVPGSIQGERQGAPLGQFADGSLLFMRYQPQDPSWTGVRRSKVELVRFDLTGEIATNFGLFDDQTVRYGGGSQYLFGAWAHTAPAANAVIYGPGDRFELREIGYDGRISRLIRLDVPPRAVTEADKEEFVNAIRERVRGTRDESFIERSYADADAASIFPAHFDVHVDDQNHIWVQDYQPWSVRVPRTWYVFEPAGAYLGAIVLPAGFDVHHIAQGKIVGRWTDEYDIEYVRVYAIEKELAGRQSRNSPGRRRFPSDESNDAPYRS
jgi:hypothetical protein